MKFTDRTGSGPVADAVLTIKDEGGPLDGLELHGWAVWASKKERGDFYATGPARQFEAGGEKRYYNFFRGEPAAKRLAGIVASEYRKENGLARPVGERRIDEGRPEVDPSDGDVPF